MLRDGLSSSAQPVVHGEPLADLEERLLGALGQLVDDHASSRIGQRPEDVAHPFKICKHLLACQTRIGIKSVVRGGADTAPIAESQ